MLSSSDPSKATVSPQLLNEAAIIVLSKLAHASRVHLTISPRGVPGSPGSFTLIYNVRNAYCIFVTNKKVEGDFILIDIHASPVE